MAKHRQGIVVVGSINMDFVSSVPHFPSPGQTIRGTSFAAHPGGKGANQAVGVARLQYPVEMIGMVGDDQIGIDLLENLRQEGVGITHIGIATGSSGTATILVDSKAENCIVVVPGANATLTPDVVRAKRSVIESAGLVMAQLETPLETITALADICQEAGVPFMLDPAPALELSAELLRKLTWFTPNETEAAFYTPGLQGIENVVSALSDLGPANVILKRGAAGSAIRIAGEKMKLIDAPQVKAADTTAAGDSFNAAFAVGLLSLGSPLESMRFATVAAAICVTRTGAQSSLAYRNEVESFVRENDIRRAHFQN